MSRTIRRKSGKKGRWVGTDWERVGSSYVRIPLKGKELAKSLAKYHGDHGWTNHACGRGLSTWFRKNEQHIYRMKAKEELIKFMKDPEYEVQIQQNPYLPYWD